MQIQKRLVVLSAVHILAYILATGASVWAAQVQLLWEIPDNPAVVGGYLSSLSSTEKFFVRVDVSEEFPFLVTRMSPYYDC